VYVAKLGTATGNFFSGKGEGGVGDRNRERQREREGW